MAPRLALSGLRRGAAFQMSTALSCGTAGGRRTRVRPGLPQPRTGLRRPSPADPDLGEEPADGWCTPGPATGEARGRVAFGFSRCVGQVVVVHRALAVEQVDGGPVAAGASWRVQPQPSRTVRVVDRSAVWSRPAHVCRTLTCKTSTVLTPAHHRRCRSSAHQLAAVCVHGLAGAEDVPLAGLGVHAAHAGSPPNASRCASCQVLERSSPAATINASRYTRRFRSCSANRTVMPVCTSA